MKSKASKKASKSAKSSFVIMIGDEGGILLHLQNKQVVKRVFCQSPSKEHTRSMNDALSANPNAPVTLLIDMMDQSYVKQTLPPVSSFNVGKIVRRRLNKDFSADDVKGYMIYGRDKNGRKDWNYLMVSLASTPVLQQWVDFAVERPNPFQGIALVPLECQPLIQAIEKKQLANIGKDTQPTEWHILISHHKVGGFRQIVLRNGQLVFTRLAQLVGEPTPEVIAGNIEQEMLNTLEYLKRLGLQDINSLTATIIASGEIKQVFSTKTIRQDQCYFYTPFEAASALSLDEVAKPEDHFGDVVIAGFIGGRRKMLLPLHTPYTAKIAKLIKYSLLCRAVACIATLGIIGWGGVIGYDWYNTQSTNEDMEITQRSLNSQLAAKTDQKNKLPQHINRYYDVANLYRSFYRPTYDVLYFTQKLFVAIRGSTTINSLEWTVSNSVVPTKDEDKRTISVEFESNLIPHENRETFVANAQKLADNIKAAFPEYEVTHSDLPGMLSDKEELKTVISESGDITSTQAKAVDTTVKFFIKSPFAKNATSPSTPLGGR